MSSSKNKPQVLRAASDSYACFAPQREPDEAMTQYPQNFDEIEFEAARIAKQLDIPPCPAILVRFNNEFCMPEPDLRRIALLISADVGLAATLLKTVNSPFYGLTHKATSVQQALSIIGLRAGANLVSGLLLRNAFPADSGPAMQRYWDSSMRIAGLAAAIASRVRDVDPDQAHTYVLFRDCGMLVMLRKFPHYADIMAQSATVPGEQLVRIEDSRFNFNHARVACALARSWSLQEELCDAIFNHHQFAEMAQGKPGAEPVRRKLVAFGLLAEQIAALHMNEGLRPDWVAGERFVLEALGIEAEDIVALSEDLLPVTA
jgi:HD-like signal output (HDOD) protein